MSQKSEWERFFDGHAPLYMQNPFVRDTLREADFLVELLALPPGSAILDIGCGTGRHAVELARRGYLLTGLDLSQGMLDQARQAALEAGVQVQWIHADATRYTPDRQYHAVLCLCEGGFGLLGSGEDPDLHDLAILQLAFAALRPGGRFVLTVLNGLRKIRQFSQADVEAGQFDSLTLVECVPLEVETPEGKQILTGFERGYLPQQLRGMHERVGFAVEHIWGGTAGRWARRALELDEMEIMVVSRKPDGPEG